jgi:uncharacterized protein
MSTNTKKTLVIGASTNPERYSYKAIQRLLHYQHPVVTIGKKTGTVLSVSIDTLPIVYTNIHTITIYLSAQHQKEYYNYLLALHPKRIIFNPGAENLELLQLAQQHGIEALEACTLVLLHTGQF